MDQPLSITIRSPTEHPILIDAVEGYLAERDVSAAVRNRLLVVLDELVANVLSHGYAPEEPPFLRLSVDVSAAGVLAELADAGLPFDPLQHPPPDTTSDLEDRPVGGLGAHLVRELTGEARYSRVEGENRLSLWWPVDR